jgi:hypothetical protein
LIAGTYYIAMYSWSGTDQNFTITPTRDGPFTRDGPKASPALITLNSPFSGKAGDWYFMSTNGNSTDKTYTLTVTRTGDYQDPGTLASPLPLVAGQPQAARIGYA